jgi:hypothetical protein
MTDMTPEQRIDANLDLVLRASGSSLDRYWPSSTMAAMREAMRKVMRDSYIQGSNDCHKAMLGERK